MPRNKIMYTGHFVADPEALLAAIPPRIPDGIIYAHHVTKDFDPFTIEDIDLGRRHNVLAYGQVAAEGVHVVLVCPEGDKELSTFIFPHITIATEQGIPPETSRSVICGAFLNGTVEPIEPPIEIPVVEGYCYNNGDVVTG